MDAIEGYIILWKIRRNKKLKYSKRVSQKEKNNFSSFYFLDLVIKCSYENLGKKKDLDSKIIWVGKN